MNIGNIAKGITSGVEAIGEKVQRNPGLLNQEIKDVFVKQDDALKKFADKLKENPKTAFLYDPSLSHKQKMDLVKKSEDLLKGQDLRREIGAPNSHLINDNFFDIEYYTNIDFRGKKSPAVKIIDITTPVNARSIEALKLACKGAQEPEMYRLKTGMDVETYVRYCREGRIEKIQAPHKTTGQPTSTGLIDPNNPKNIEAANRYKALAPKDSKHFHGKSVNIVELSKLGFGTPKDLAAYVRAGALDGTIKIIGKNEKGQNIVQVFVNTSTPKSRCVLQDLRERGCVRLDDLAKRSGIKASQIEDAVLSGEMVSVDRMFECDFRTPYFDVNDPRNIAGFDKLQFEKRLQREMLEQESQARRDLLSVKTKLAWHFCPETRLEAQKAFAQSELKGISAQINKIKEALSNPELSPEEVENLEGELAQLYQKENSELRKTFALMWSRAGSQEYKSGIARAQEILNQVKKSGINSIDDAEVVHILTAHQS